MFFRERYCCGVSAGYPGPTLSGTRHLELLKLAT